MTLKFLWRAVASGILGIAIFIVFGFVTETFAHKDIYIISDNDLPILIPGVISDIIDKNESPYAKTLATGETLTIAYTRTASFKAQPAIAHGNILCDGVKYDYFVLIQKLPLTNIYVCRRLNTYIDKGGIEAGFAGQSFNYFWRSHLILNRNDGTISGSIEPDGSKIFCCLIIGFGITYGQYKTLRKRLETIADD